MVDIKLEYTSTGHSKFACYALKISNDATLAACGGVHKSEAQLLLDLLPLKVYSKSARDTLEIQSYWLPAEY
jgi:hypothetical protein